MKKTLVAVAVAGMATGAFAQSNVTIYGAADASVQGQSINGGQPNGPSGNTTKIESNTSILGFRGTEDLGNGNKGLFQMETQFNITGNGTGQTAYSSNGSNFLTLRDSFVGLQNDKAGTVRAGYMSTPYKTVQDQVDVFNTRNDTQMDTVFGRTVLGAGAQGTNGNPANFTAQQTAYNRMTSVYYTTPIVGGVTGKIAYSGNGGNNDTNNVTNGATVTGSITPNSTLSGSLGWSGFGFDVLGAVQQSNYTNAAGSPITPIANALNYMAAVQYTGVPGLRTSAAYGRNQQSINQTASTSGAGIASNSAYAGVAYRFQGTNWEPRASYVYTSNSSGNDQVASQNGARQWNGGVWYYLSKRTEVYGLVSVLTNNANGVYAFSGSTGQGTNVLTGGQQLVTYGIGMRTNF